MPGGVPKFVRCYDNGGTEKEGGSIDRYTVCFTGGYRKLFPESMRRHYGEREWFQYLAMSGSPFHPQGFGQHGESAQQIDRPTYGHLGRKIKFVDLPEDCRKLVISDYRQIWGLVA